MPKRLKLFLPLLVFLLLISVFLYTLLKKDYNPRLLPSALIDKPMPAFQLPLLMRPDVAVNEKQITQGKPTLLNIWASWCVSCRVEHPFLDQLAKQGVRIVGVNYKDERSDAEKWLANLGNPYQMIIFDYQGGLGLDLGVYGAPETYLLDGEGIIRYKHVGVVDETVWQSTLKALYQQWQKP